MKLSLPWFHDEEDCCDLKETDEGHDDGVREQGWLRFDPSEDEAQGRNDEEKDAQNDQWNGQDLMWPFEQIFKSANEHDLS